MSILEFIMWILHIIFSVITIGVMVAVAFTYFIDVNWFEKWIDKNKISKFVENFLIFIGVISPTISIITGIILKEILVW